MQITASSAVELFLAAGVYTASKWSLERIQAKIDSPQGMARYASTLRHPPLLTELIEAQGRRELITVVEDRVPGEDVAKRAKESKTTPAPKAKKPKPPKIRPLRSGPYKARLKDWAQRPVEITRKGPGVMLVVLEELILAGKTDTPTTKHELLGILTAKFPDRHAAGMMTNLNNLIPGRFREHYHIEVLKKRIQGGRMAYWIDPKTAVPKGA